MRDQEAGGKIMLQYCMQGLDSLKPCAFPWLEGPFSVSDNGAPALWACRRALSVIVVAVCQEVRSMQTHLCLPHVKRSNASAD